MRAGVLPNNEEPSEGPSWREAQGPGTKMTRQFRFLHGLLFSVFAFAFYGADRAPAEGACPPAFIADGAMVPGQENAGWTGCLHAYDAADGGDGAGPSSGGGSGLLPSTPLSSAPFSIGKNKWRRKTKSVS